MAPLEFAITFGQLSPTVWEDAALAADALGFESVWLPEHVVFPVEMRGELVPGEAHPPVPPSVPVYEPGAYLSWLAGRTQRVRLGTFVYLLGLRHPFLSARTFATLDLVSGGRAEVGVGVGWLLTEYEALGLETRGRGRRLDEAIDVCVRLWTEEVIEHHGACWDFAPVMFEPKPAQRPHPPIVVGGESEAALRRAAGRGQGWIGMSHTPESAAAQVDKLRRFEDEIGRDGDPVKVTVMGPVNDASDIDRWQAAGVDRLIVVPWDRSRHAVAAMETFAARYLGGS